MKKAKNVRLLKTARKTKVQKPVIGIIMGSDSDMPIMEKAFEILTLAKVNYEVQIVSAHRTPNEMITYAETAAKRGLKVIIAGAGGAAHLPGMVASATSLPVIGVPVDITPMQGWDALLSIMQMPKGVPVATVGIDNAANAGLLALRILGIENKSVQKFLVSFKSAQKLKVKAANKNL